MTAPVLRPRSDLDGAVPAPAVIVRWYPNPLDIIRAYVESDCAQQLASEHERMVRHVAEQSPVVTDAESYQHIGEQLVAVVAHRKQVENWFEPVINFAFRLHRLLCDRKTSVLAPLNAFEASAKRNWDGFRRAEEQQRRDEEARLAEIGRCEEQARLEREAALLEQRGEQAMANQVLEQALSAPAPVITIASALPPAKGISSRERWTWRPLGGDTPATRARALQLVPREFLKLDEVKLNAYARTYKASAKVQGLEFYDAGSVSVRT